MMPLTGKGAGYLGWFKLKRITIASMVTVATMVAINTKVTTALLSL